MKGFIVQVNQDYINCQNMLIGSIDHALMFRSQSDADLVATGHRCEGVSVQVLPHENNSVAAGVSSSGTYFEYHKDF
jgi:hypothetical protein